MANQLCLRCGKNPAEHHPRYGVVNCTPCRQTDTKIKEAPRFATISEQDRITSQQDHHLGDLAQPWTEDGKPNPTFVKANSREDVLEYFSPEQLNEAGL